MIIGHDEVFLAGTHAHSIIDPLGAEPAGSTIETGNKL